MKNLEEIKKFSENFWSQNSRKPKFWAIGRVEKGILDNKKSLSVNYAVLNVNENFGFLAVLLDKIQKYEKVNFNEKEAVIDLDKDVVKNVIEEFEFLIDDDKNHQNLQTLLLIDQILKDENGENYFCLTMIFEDDAPKSVESVYLKFYLLSGQKVPLKSLNLNGAFGILPNVAWDENSRPIELQWLRENEIWLKMYGMYPKISSVDKFPRFLSHIIPADNTRILDDAKVRMGAVIADGTTIMPGASYVNFNSGTKGAVMVEGRISSAVEVGEGSDIGGGASILGVLSGTNGNAVTIGKRCLLGANSVTGIPLGDDCIVDAGIAVLEGTKILINEKNRQNLAKINPNFSFDKEIYKGLELAKLNGLHFRLDSQSGVMNASLNKKVVKLNEDLH